MKRSYSGRLSIFQACAVDDSRVGAAAFRVLACLGTHSDVHGWCRPSQTLIGQRLGISRQAVNKQIKILETLGYLEIRQRFNPKTKAQLTSWYRLILDYELPDEYRRLALDVDDPDEDTPSPDVAPPETSEVAGPVTPRVAPPATPEVARTSQLNDSLNENIDPYQKHLERIREMERLTAEEKRRRQNRGLR